MKKQTIIIIMLFLIVKLNFGQNWQWVQHIGSNYQLCSDLARSIITDRTNSYVIGSYGGTLNLPGSSLNSNGFNDIFISKFDANGSLLWAKTLGGNYNQPDAFEDANGVYDSINNCIFISGSFVNSINFGNGIILNSTHSNKEDVFIARMDLNGNFIWAKQGGSTGIDMAYVFAEPNGDVLLAGTLQNSGIIDTINISAGGFFAKFNSNGNIKWAKHKFAGFSRPRISFLGSDIVMAGAFNANPTTIDTVTMIPVGLYDGFITRMDSLGKIKWIEQFGGVDQDGFSGICTNSLNEIYAVGFFNDTITINGTSLINAGGDILIAKFNQNGGLLWARQTHATGNSTANSVITDNANIYVTGLFAGNASFGNNNISTTNPPDMFLARYDSSGNCYGVMHFGQASGACLVRNNSNNIVCAGAFYNTINIADSVFTSYGPQDIFIANADAITGINEKKQNDNNHLIIYANPTTGKCNITVPDDFLNEKNLTLSIFNINGQLIQQKKLEMNDGKIKLNLEEEAKGIYNVTLSDEKKVYSGKIVFE